MAADSRSLAAPRLRRSLGATKEHHPGSSSRGDRSSRFALYSNTQVSWIMVGLAPPKPTPPWRTMRPRESVVIEA